MEAFGSTPTPWSGSADIDFYVQLRLETEALDSAIVRVSVRRVWHPRRIREARKKKRPVFGPPFPLADRPFFVWVRRLNGGYKNRCPRVFLGWRAVAFVQYFRRFPLQFIYIFLRSTRDSLIESLPIVAAESIIRIAL